MGILKKPLGCGCLALGGLAMLVAYHVFDPIPRFMIGAAGIVVQTQYENVTHFEAVDARVEGVRDEPTDLKFPVFKLVQLRFVDQGRERVEEARLIKSNKLLLELQPGDDVTAYVCRDESRRVVLHRFGKRACEPKEEAF